MGVISGIGAGLSGLFDALSKPLFTRKTTYFNRRKGVLRSTHEDTWSISLAHVVFIWLIVTAMKVLRDHKDDTPEAQAGILAALMLAGPFAGLGVAMGLDDPPAPGTKPDHSKSARFYTKILEIAKLLPGFF